MLLNTIVATCGAAPLISSTSERKSEKRRDDGRPMSHLASLTSTFGAYGRPLQERVPGWSQFSGYAKMTAARSPTPLPTLDFKDPSSTSSLSTQISRPLTSGKTREAFLTTLCVTTLLLQSMNLRPSPSKNSISSNVKPWSRYSATAKERASSSYMEQAALHSTPRQRRVGVNHSTPRQCSEKD